VLWLSTAAFTLLFNVWMMLGVLSVPLRRELGLSDAQLEWMIAAAILSGALFRLNFGMLAETYGGRLVMGVTVAGSAVAAYAFSQATTYPWLLATAILYGLAGNSFSAGVVWNSAWFPERLQGTALGIFGAGNVGAAGTKLMIVLFPGLLTLVPSEGYLGGASPGGWRFVPALYAALLVLMAVAVFKLSPTPDRMRRGRPLADRLAPLRHMRVWRFGLYYLVVFGAYVALSAWLPMFYVNAYGLPLPAAALLSATFILPASLLRPLGGHLSDRLGPRGVTYAVFIVMCVSSGLLSLPARLDIRLVASLMFVLGCAMGIGKASVFKYIPDYFPRDVAAVGGVVAMLGALGGFFLPPAFGSLARMSGNPQVAFTMLFGLSLVSLVWLHVTVTALSSAEPPLRGIDEQPRKQVVSPSLELARPARDR
jgi:NNP family nitrate/nitrite transporter-like MFS transporter